MQMTRTEELKEKRLMETRMSRTDDLEHGFVSYLNEASPKREIAIEADIILQPAFLLT